MSNVNTFSYDESDRIIRGIYDENVDVKKLHILIKKVLQHQKELEMRNIANEGIGTVKLLESNDINLEKSMAIFSRVMRSVQICSDPKEEEYEERSAPWVKKISEIKIKDQKTKQLKIALFDGYLKLCGKYVKINISYNTGDHNTITCQSCNSMIPEETDDHCPNCSMIINRYLVSSAFIDVSRSSESTSRQPKHLFEKFNELYMRFQGRSDVVITDDKINTVTKYISSNYPKISCTEERRSDNIAIMIKCLNETKNAKHIVDRNLFMKRIWGYDTPNLKKLDYIIYTNWHKHQAIIDENKDENDRQTIAFNEWRLWREINCALSQTGDLPLFSQTEFQISSNKDGKRKAERLWKLCCEKCNMRYDDDLEIGF